MSEKPSLSFRSIGAPLDVDDAALERINDEMGVPALTAPSIARERKARPAEKAEPSAAKPLMRAPLEKLTIEVPSYLADDLKRAALDQRVSVRHLVLLALLKSGFDIAAADMVPDGRRSASRAR